LLAAVRRKIIHQRKVKPILPAKHQSALNNMKISKERSTARTRIISSSQPLPSALPLPLNFTVDLPHVTSNIVRPLEFFVADAAPFLQGWVVVLFCPRPMFVPNVSQYVLSFLRISPVATFFGALLMFSYVIGVLVPVWCPVLAVFPVATKSNSCLFGTLDTRRDHIRRRLRRRKNERASDTRRRSWFLRLIWDIRQF